MTDARLHVMDHPLILHKISMLRAKETNTKDFRQLIHEIALLIGYEATRDLPVTEYTVTTPVADASDTACRIRSAWCRFSAPGSAWWTPSSASFPPRGSDISGSPAIPSR